MGPVWPYTLSEYGIIGTVIYAKIKLQALSDFVMNGKRKFKEFNRFPSTSLDISLVVDKKVQWSEIESIVRQFGGNLLQSTNIFEADYLHPVSKLPEFHKKLHEKGQKNIAFRIVFGSNERTLKDSEISPIYAKITEELKNNLNAEIR